VKHSEDTNTTDLEALWASLVSVLKAENLLLSEMAVEDSSDECFALDQVTGTTYTHTPFYHWGLRSSGLHRLLRRSPSLAQMFSILGTARCVCQRHIIIEITY
jgi:hypothetical protein